MTKKRLGKKMVKKAGMKDMMSRIKELEEALSEARASEDGSLSTQETAFERARRAEEKLAETQARLEEAINRAEEAEELLGDHSDFAEESMELAQERLEIEIELRKSREYYTDAEKEIGKMRQALEKTRQQVDAFERVAHARAHAADEAVELKLRRKELESALDEVRHKAEQAELRARKFQELAELTEERAYEAEEALWRLEETSSEKREILSHLVVDRQVLQETLQISLRQVRRRQRRLAFLAISVAKESPNLEITKLVSKRLENVVRESDILGYLGREGFAIIIPELADEDSVARSVGHLSERLRNAFSGPLIGDKTTLKPRVAIGVSVYPEDGAQGPVLFRRALAAMSLAREEKSEQARYFQRHPFT